MATWFRTYYEDEDLWLHFEADDEGWATRQVEVRRKDSQPVAAASLEEVLHLRDHADLTAMGRYEQQYGVLAEGSLDGWQDQPQTAAITAEEFEHLWAGARRRLDDASGRPDRPGFVETTGEGGPPRTEPPVPFF